MLVDNIVVECPTEMSEEEAAAYVQQERKLWEEKGKVLGKVNIKVDGEEVVLKSYQKSPIRRIRRITGYLSEVSNFNQAKRAELSERVAHC